MLPLQQFKDYISQQSLFTTQDQLLLAVSGGRDSVLMAHLFKQAGFNFAIAHCNFNLRGAESVRDEHFVKTLAEILQVPIHIQHFQTKDYAAAHQVSIQMAARDLRYHWFEEVRLKEGYTGIALAQHQDDAIETVLLNLTRGTGIAGLHGILPKRGRLIRPLLFLSRAEIDRLIEVEKIAYVEDSSNRSTNYARNKIRLKVLPQLKEINRNLERTFQQNIQRFAETELVLQQAVAALSHTLLVQQGSAVHLSVAKVNALVPQKLLLFEVMRPYGFSEPVIADVLQALDKQSGLSFYSATHQLTLDREDLILVPLKNQAAMSPLLVHSGEAILEFQYGKLQFAHLRMADFNQQFEPGKAYLDADKLIFPLLLRSRQNGDRFMPIGMTQFKKLSDFFIDEKVPVTQKDEIPILINGDGAIIWVLGQRQDNRYKITSATENITILAFTKAHITFSKQS